MTEYLYPMTAPEWDAAEDDAYRRLGAAQSDFETEEAQSDLRELYSYLGRVAKHEL